MFGKGIISVILAGAIAGNIPFRVQEIELLNRKEPVLYFVSKEKIPEYLETLEYQIDK